MNDDAELHSSDIHTVLCIKLSNHGNQPLLDLRSFYQKLNCNYYGLLQYQCIAPLAYLFNHGKPLTIYGLWYYTAQPSSAINLLIFHPYRGIVKSSENGAMQLNNLLHDADVLDIQLFLGLSQHVQKFRYLMSNYLYCDIMAQAQDWQMQTLLQSHCQPFMHYKIKKWQEIFKYQSYAYIDTRYVKKNVQQVADKMSYEIAVHQALIEKYHSNFSIIHYNSACANNSNINKLFNGLGCLSPTGLLHQPLREIALLAAGRRYDLNEQIYELSTHALEHNWIKCILPGHTNELCKKAAIKYSQQHLLIKLSAYIAENIWLANAHQSLPLLRPYYHNYQISMENQQTNPLWSLLLLLAWSCKDIDTYLAQQGGAGKKIWFELAHKHTVYVGAEIATLFDLQSQDEVWTCIGMFILAGEKIQQYYACSQEEKNYYDKVRQYWHKHFIENSELLLVHNNYIATLWAIFIQLSYNPCRRAGQL